MTNFDRFLDVLKNEIVALARENLEDYLEDAIRDGRSFLEESRADLERWTMLLAREEITQEDFRSLVKGQRELAQMKALTQAGLASVRRDRFVNAVVDTVIRTAFAVFL